MRSGHVITSTNESAVSLSSSDPVLQLTIELGRTGPLHLCTGGTGGPIREPIVIAAIICDSEMFTALQPTGGAEIPPNVRFKQMLR